MEQLSDAQEQEVDECAQECREMNEEPSQQWKPLVKHLMH